MKKPKAWGGGGVFGEFISASHSSASPMQLQSNPVFWKWSPEMI